MATNKERKCSEYIYELSGKRLERLVQIAVTKDEPLAAIVLSAIDQYIWRETNERVRQR